MAFEQLVRYLIENPYVFFGLWAACCIIVVLVLTLYSPRSGNNPFSADHVKPPSPLVTNHAVRNKVLKQRFKSQKIPENLDAIVIGSGIGGLSTAVLLSRAGQKVLVLEQHDQAGGCCHTFVDKGFEFDTGVHYVGKMMDGDLTRALTDQLTEGQVVWVPTEAVYHRVAIGPSDKAKFYTMLGGTPTEFADNLKRQFPGEEDAVDTFMEQVSDVTTYFVQALALKLLPRRLMRFLIWSGLASLIWKKYTKLSKLSAREVMDGITDNEEFKNVMFYIFGDMGPTPSEIGWMGFAVLMKHYMTGAFYPLGGPSEIAFHIIPIIERYGGRVLVDAPVTQILVNDQGRAHGALYPLGGPSEIAFHIIPIIERYGGRVLVDAPVTQILVNDHGMAHGVRVHKSGGDFNIFAKRIISDAGVINTFKKLLPKEIAINTALYRCIDKVGPCVSSITVFLGLTGSPSELTMTTANTWAFTGNDIEKGLYSYWSLSVEEASESDCPFLFISFPSAKDPSWESRYPGKSVALIITLVPWSWFSPWKDGKVNHRGDEYQALKERFGHQMLRQCEQLHPELDGKMEYLDVGTPLSNKYYLGQPQGEMYGLDHNRTRFSPEISVNLRPETEVPGLYLTGQDVLNCGFTGALYAGAMTAEVILSRNLMNDLVPVVKEIRKRNKTKKAN